MNRIHYRRLLLDYFNDDDLRNLCFELNIDYDVLPGDGKDAKVRELVQYCERHQRMAELREAGRRARPQLDWGTSLPTQTETGWAATAKQEQLFVSEDAIDLSTHIVATYRLRLAEGEGALALHHAFTLLAFDPTIGTWTDTARLDPDLLEEFSGKVLYPLPNDADPNPHVRIAIPVSNIDPIDGGVAQLLAILGVPFTLKAIPHLRLIDLALPSSFTQTLPGPRYGVPGLYERLQASRHRPLLATMLKPRVGLTTEQYAADAKEALLGGVDIILDDEVMGSSSRSSVRSRVRALRQVIAEVEDATGEPKAYAVNATTSAARIEQLALELQDLGADALYVNPVTMGFTILELLRATPGLALPLLCCRAMHGVLTRNRDHGIAMSVLLKLARLCGADAMHVGSVRGKLPHTIVGDTKQVMANVRALRGRLRQVEAALPIVSGGLHPGNLAWTVESLGRELIIQAGSGVLAHPLGPRAGARAMRLVANAVCAGTPWVDLARSHEEVQAAFRAWGYVVSDQVLSYEARPPTQQEAERRTQLLITVASLQGQLQQLERSIEASGGLAQAPLDIWNEVEAVRRSLTLAQTDLERLGGHE